MIKDRRTKEEPSFPEALEDEYELKHIRMKILISTQSTTKVVFAVFFLKIHVVF